MRLSDQVIMVSGASAGIGKATAIRLAEEGARVFGVDRDQTALEATINEIRAGNGVAEAQVCDISDEESVQFAFSQCLERYGRLDHLCNVAGIIRFDHFHDLATEDFQRVIGINLVGTFLMCRSAISHLKISRGSIVNVVSAAAIGGTPWMGAYSASKGAVLSMSRSLAVEYSQDGIRVNCVSPGQIETKMSSADLLPENVNYDLLRRCLALTGPGDPASVAGVIAMLVSEDGKHISGENVRIDGAMLA